MEDVIQRVFAVLISVIVFFLFPLYITFEKKDDISYALALKITSNFVDNVTNKGYITSNMYNKFISDLAVTGNVYDVKIEHRAKKYNPVIQTYKKESGKYIRDTSVEDKEYFTSKDILFKSGELNLTKNDEKDEHGNNYIKSASDTNIFYQIGYKENEEIYNWDQISKILYDDNNLVEADDYNTSSSNSYIIIKDLIDSELTRDNNKIYPMSEGDEFNVIIKNTNITIASVLFNTLTMGANADNNTKVYINYGGTIQNEDYKVK